MKRLLTCLLLAAALVTNVCALEVPTDTTIQNLNGSQQLIKTYTTVAFSFKSIFRLLTYALTML